MEQAKNIVINLDNSDIKLHTLELILRHFEHLSNDIAEDLLIAELLRSKLADILSIKKVKVKNFDYLANEIDFVLDKYKSKIILEINQIIKNSSIQDVLTIETNLST
jgi:hypothetical protein